MSSSTWTAAALLSNAQPAAGDCWRLVETQHYVSTLKLTDTREEQERLEALIEATKPKVPPECQHLHYLLFTPFRYGAPYPTGSRFRRAGFTQGVFYASRSAETAAAEITFNRLLLFAESPATPWPVNAGEFTAFRVKYATALSIDLTRSPFDVDRAMWRHPTDYAACQQIAENARDQGIDVITYESARDPARRLNTAILSCRAFATTEPSRPQTWRIHLSASGARAICEFPRQSLDFGRDAFSADPRIATLNWAR